MLRNVVKGRENSVLVGIDEAGRGPLAGPIAVGVFAVTSKDVLRKFRGVKESKQLSEADREEWFAKIRQFQREGIVDFAVSFCGASVIDDRGLTWVTRSSMDRALKRLEDRSFILPHSRILLDGSLYAPARFTNQLTIIDGDAKEAIIALASICAKVLRDRMMKSLAREYEGYGFDVHKGYGTKAHYAAIKKHGLSPIHRRSFLRKILGE